MLRLEVPYFGHVPNRVAIASFVGLLGIAGGIGYWSGNGTTTENAISDISSKNGELSATVRALSTDTESLSHPHVGSETKMPELPSAVPPPKRKQH